MYDVKKVSQPGTFALLGDNYSLQIIETWFAEPCIFMPLKDGACTNLFEYFSENSLQGDLSNDTTLNPPPFSLVNTFNRENLSFGK